MVISIEFNLNTLFPCNLLAEKESIDVAVKEKYGGMVNEYSILNQEITKLRLPQLKSQKEMDTMCLKSGGKEKQIAMVLLLIM